MVNKKAIEYGRAYEEYVGKVMAGWREYRRLTQDNIGSELDVSGRTVGKYEKASIPVKASTMAAVSRICDFDLIEYIPGEGSSIARKFQKLTGMCGIDPHFSHVVPSRRLRLGSLQNIRFMDYTPDGRTLFSATTNEDIQEKKAKPKPDILTDLPKTQPLPLCDDDNAAFEQHMIKQGNNDRLRILLYGYRLMMLFQEMGTPRQTTSSMARQILRRLIKTYSGEIDQDVYSYYWKCVYDSTVGRY